MLCEWLTLMVLFSWISPSPSPSPSRPQFSLVGFSRSGLTLMLCVTLPPDNIRCSTTHPTSIFGEGEVSEGEGENMPIEHDAKQWVEFIPTVTTEKQIGSSSIQLPGPPLPKMKKGPGSWIELEPNFLYFTGWKPSTISHMYLQDRNHHSIQVIRFRCLRIVDGHSG